tara:strand:+ start:324 stop:671 length:348 start_codon:yes stop_codon:yes gene_type:complete
MNFMSKVELILTLVTLVSIGMNVLMFVYSRNVTAKLLRIADEIGDLRDAATNFATHVREVYELEMFYGDQTLKSLMDHAGAFRDYMDGFDYIYITDEIEQDEQEPNEQNTQTEEV